jgi:4-amino-4-deoxy-L-arabinose transferase-like glycosyltransferase
VGKSFVALLRQHWTLLAVLGVATFMRVWFVYAYPYAFFFPDSRTYVASAQDGFPNVIRPWGYSGLILPFLHQPYVRIAVIQHVIGLGLIIAGYAFLRRRGVKGWLAAVAMVPLALDARVLTIEHYVLAETAYLAFTAAGLFLIAWRDKVGWVAAALGGTLLAAAALTRSVGLPILALAGVYLLVRRVGILRLIAYAVPVVGLLGGYMVWYHQQWGVYAMGQYQGRFLYARVVSIADCATLKLTDDQKRLCLPNPTTSWDQRPDQFIWATSSPAYRFYHDREDDPALQKYALTVIEQEPGKFLALVARQTGWHLMWRAPLVDDGECLATQWLPPARPGDLCEARYYLPVKPGESPAPAFLVDNAQARALHAYGNWMTTPGPLYAAGVLVTLFAAVWRFRRRPWRDAADAMLFTFGGFGLLIVSVATSLFDYRYAEPAVILIPVGIALAVNRIVALASAPSPSLSPLPFEAATDGEPPTVQIERAGTV